MLDWLTLFFRNLLFAVRETIISKRDLEKACNIDVLTGLLRREVILLAGRDEFVHCCHHRARFSVAILDLKGLKTTNNREGAAQGDILLQRFAQAICQSVRSPKHTGRLGGDEFLVVLPGVDRRTANLIVDRVRAQTGVPKFHFGIASLDELPENGTFGQLLELADLGVRASKAAATAAD